MIYLKSFENHQDWWYKSVPYRELCIGVSGIEKIEEDDSWSQEDMQTEEIFRSENWIPFTESEIAKLKSMLGRIEIPKWFEVGQGARIESTYFDLIIFKIIDDWFYVIGSSTRKVGTEYDPSYWKCDEFNGLVSFIENEILPESNRKKDPVFESTKNKLYLEIDEEDFSSDEFTDVDIQEADQQKIKNIIKDNLLFSIKKASDEKFRFIKIAYDLNKSTIEARKFECSIFEITDEYYLVEFESWFGKLGSSGEWSTRYFKCDQFEGLKNLLYDLGLTKDSPGYVL